jgi:hypothetical protein
MSSKKYHLLVQSIEFNAGISQNNRSIMVLSNSPKLTLCLSSSNDMNVGDKSDFQCKNVGLDRIKNLYVLVLSGLFLRELILTIIETFLKLTMIHSTD